MAQTQVNVVESKKKVFVPPMRYPLQRLGCFETIMNIVELTHGLKDLPKDIARAIEKDVCSREFSYYGFIPAPPSVDMVKQIIGIDGYYLKLTTQKSGVNFIWHDRDRNEFQFWGEYQSCIRAMNAIRYRICKYVESVRSYPEERPLDTVNVSVMKNLIGKLAASAIDTKPTVVFDNDVNPNPMVCWEGHCIVDDDTGRWKIIDEKLYPATF